jgi:hypothetical protein
VYLDPWGGPSKKQLRDTNHQSWKASELPAPILSKILAVFEIISAYFQANDLLSHASTIDCASSLMVAKRFANVGPVPPNPTRTRITRYFRPRPRGNAPRLLHRLPLNASPGPLLHNPYAPFDPANNPIRAAIGLPSHPIPPLRPYPITVALATAQRASIIRASPLYTIFAPTARTHIHPAAIAIRNPSIQNLNPTTYDVSFNWRSS